MFANYDETVVKSRDGVFLDPAHINYFSIFSG